MYNQKSYNDKLKPQPANKIKNFRDLQIWKLGKEVSIDTYRATKTFPKEEMYGLISQMRRAAVSITSNIAEGFNRKHNSEYRQFLYIALGSCTELETQTEISTSLGLMCEKEKEQLLLKLNHESAMLRNLIKKL